MRRFTVLTFALVCVCLAAGQSTVSKELNGNLLLCGEGLSTGQCQFSQAMLRLAFARLQPNLSSWRFVVVKATRWSKLCKDFKVRICAPAFTRLDSRTTYFISSLTLLDDRIDEYLQQYTNLTGRDRLEWVAAHELGHILCQSLSEAEAEHAGGKLRFSDKHDGGCQPRQLSAGRP